MSLNNSFEQALNSPSDSIDRDLIRELVTLRQFKAEREALILTNNQLIVQLSELEVNSADLKFQLEAKDLENTKLRTRIRTLQASESGRDQVSDFNVTLSHSNSRKSELSIDSIQTQKLDMSMQLMKEQLEQEKKLRVEFQQKYQTLLEKQQQDVNRKKIEDQLEKAKKQIISLILERNYYKDQLVPSLENTILTLKKSKEKTESELKFFKKEICQVQESQEYGLKKHNSEKCKVGLKPKTLSKQKARSKGKIGNIKVAAYKPSFMRQKKTTIDETFADSFPDDNELE